MTKNQQLESLRQARQACLFLHDLMPALSTTHQALLDSLISEFTRLDEKEQRQRDRNRLNGLKGAIHGHKGGRPRKDSKLHLENERKT